MDGGGAARSNNCRGLLVALGEAQTSYLWLCRLSQGAAEQAIEIPAFSCSCGGLHPRHPNEINLIPYSMPLNLTL